MNFSGIIRSIFIKIAKKLGLHLSAKPSSSFDYNNISGISLTAAIANRVATLTTMDATISVTGDSSRARYIDGIIQDLVFDKLSVFSEVSLGTGDVLLKPYIDNSFGSRMGIDIIKNDDFYICECVGDFIKSCIIRCEELKTESGNIFERFEVQKLENREDSSGKTIPCCVIYQLAYKNGSEVPLSTIKAWENFSPMQIIPNVQNLMIARVKCPTVNRNNINGANGVPITYGLEGVMNNVIEAYDAFNDELRRKQAFIFIDKTLFTRDKDGNTIVPNGRDRLFMQLPRVNNDDGSNSLIQEYSPNIRANEFETGIDVNKSMLELLCGLDSGILTSPETSHATATELKASLQLTFAFITRFQRNITRGIKDLAKIIDIMASAINLPLFGEYSVVVDWSSSYVEDVTEQFNRLMQAHDIGAVSTAEVRSWLQNEDLSIAEDRVKEIAAESPKDGV